MFEALNVSPPSAEEGSIFYFSFSLSPDTLLSHFPSRSDLSEHGVESPARKCSPKIKWTIRYGAATRFRIEPRLSLPPLLLSLPPPSPVTSCAPGGEPANFVPRLLLINPYLFTSREAFQKFLRNNDSDSLAGNCATYYSKGTYKRSRKLFRHCVD